MSKPRVLFDLSLGHKKVGFAGIPQYSRILFDSLGELDSLEVDGLLSSNGGVWHGGDLGRLEAQARFLGSHLQNAKEHLVSRLVAKLSGRGGHAVERLFLGRKRKYKTEPLRSELVELVWRELFASTIEADRRKTVQERNYLVSDIGLSSMNDAAYLGLKGPKLDTSGFDFVLFQCPRKFKATGSSQKVISYHDGLPVLAADVIPNDVVVREHFRSTRACEKDSLFVCVSTSARNDLDILSPAAADRATVIPAIVPPMSAVTCTRQSLEDIARMRISESTLPKSARKGEIVNKWLDAGGSSNYPPRYIMTLSTIEPRKNIPALISAWQRLRETDPDLRLLIAGKPGWKYEETLNAMRPFVEQGLILHVESVAQRELRHLYSAASCFVFPSFAEGFGLPPVEAMQCGCPVAVSDIPAHRYMAGDAALYFDPYDRSDIAEKISLALDADKALEMREKGFRNAERFTQESVLPQWEAFFEKHMKRPKG